MNTFPTTGPITATLDICCGDIVARAADRADCTVTVEPRDTSKEVDVRAAAAARIEFADGVLTVTATKPRQRFTGPTKKDGNVLVVVQLPSASALEARTGFGSIRIEGELAGTAVRTGMGDLRMDHVGALTAKTGHGDVVAARIGGNAIISTGSGAVRLGVIEGGATVRNANGSIGVAQCAQAIHVRTSSGDISVGRALSSVSAGSGAGDIQVDEVSTGSVRLRTGYGSIQVGVRDGVAAWLDAASKFGCVRNGLAVANGPGHSQSTVQVRARTSTGDITVSRADAA